MPRLPRIDIPGLIYHVNARGVKRLPLFYTDMDRQKFLRCILTAQQIFPFRLHAYCLMSNHYHLLIQTVNSSLAKAVHYFQRPYAGWFNRTYGHVGHVFQGRFHSIPVEEDAYFTTVARYIHLNPVHARLVSIPEEYPWSDYGRLMRGETDPLVDHRFLLDYFGADPAQQRERYRRFVMEGLKKPEAISDRALQRMRFWGEPPLELRATCPQ